MLHLPEFPYHSEVRYNWFCFIDPATDLMVHVEGDTGEASIPIDAINGRRMARLLGEEE